MATTTTCCLGQGLHADGPSWYRYDCLQASTWWQRSSAEALGCMSARAIESWLRPVANLARQLVLYDHAAGKPILAQLALKLSEALEQQSWAQIQGKFKQLGSKVTAKFKFISMEDSFASKYRVAKTCTFYVQSTKAARSCWQHMSASTDKGDGGQLPLQHTVFAFPDNQIFVALPQASFASIGMA